jgi:alpha-tubulin suppressor-like RCC1 family protein
MDARRRVRRLLKETGLRVKAISCGNEHTAVILSDGTLWTAGYNSYGQLCRNVATGSPTATNFGQVAGVSALSVGCGGTHTAVILSDGTLWTAGYNSSGQLCRAVVSGSPTATNFGQVAGVSAALSVGCGNEHTAVILSDGTLWTAGNNTYGRLCRNVATGSNTATNFGQVAGVSVLSVGCGGTHTAVILSDGTLWTAGYNSSGQLCRNVADGSPTATNFGQVAGVSAQTVGCRTNHTAVILSDGTLWTAGYNSSGQLCRNVADGSPTATNFGQVAGVSALSVGCGEYHAAVILSDRTLWTAGYNTRGQLCRNVANASATATNFGQVLME